MYSPLNRCLYRYYLKVVSTEIPKLTISKSFHERVFTVGDNLEEFTLQLTQKKARKWSMEKVTHKPVYDYQSINNIDKNISDDELEFCSIEKINSLFQEYIQIGHNSNIIYLVKRCIDLRKCPSLSNINYILALCAQNGDKDTIIEIEKLCEEFNPDIAKANSHFKHYIAEAIWVKGNIPESLKIFKELYDNNAFLRRRVKIIFKNLMHDVVSTRSEAALISILKFAEDILSNYEDSFLLVCVWQACFLSEWFTDQCLSMKLLEKHEGLCHDVVSRIPYVVAISLSSHRIEIVYRLLEVLLKYEMKMQYSIVLSALLDYQISQRDLRSSTEIIRWSINNGVQLPAYQNEKFLELLISRSNDGFELVNKIDSIKKEKVNRDFKF